MSELPVFAIIGRPNVGKSTLFNFLTKTRQALVADYPGVTRDRQYGRGVVGGRPYWVIDTGGLMEGLDQPVETLVEKQVWQAIKEADQVFFVVDAETGLTAGDAIIAEKLRPFQKKLSLVVNKIDRTSPEVAVGDFYRLGMGEPQAISAKNGRGIEKFVETILNHFPQPPALTSEENAGVFIAVIGRPNVGKSTLINRLLGEERVIVFDAPGTTRDSIFIPYERHGKCYTLIDTAGVRRRGRVEEGIEKFSVVKTLQAMEKADVNILVFDASEGIADQDLKLLGLLLETGKGLVLAFNKWDGLSDYQKEQVKQAIDRRLEFVNFARRYLISALHGTGVGDLYRAVDEAYASATKSLPTPILTETLEQAVYDHQPPLVSGRRIRLRYAHLGGQNPLTIVIHGKQISSLPNSYRRYLANYFRKTFNLVGIPLHIELVNDKNPYVNKT